VIRDGGPRVAAITPQRDMPDQFGRFAIVLLALASLFSLLRYGLFTDFMFWILVSGGVALTLFSVVARPLGSPRRETWFAAMLCAALLVSVLTPLADGRLALR